MNPPYRSLIVDNHSLIRSGLTLLLNSTDDFVVVGDADNGEVALALVRELRPNVVIMDLSMPGTGGLSAMTAILASAPATRAAILTRFSDRFHVRQALDSGAAAYVLKSSPPSRILEALRCAVAGGTYVDPALKAPRSLEVSSKPAISRDRIDLLTPRELAVLRATAAGASSKEIATRLDVSTRTVEFHKYNGMRRLALRGRAALVTLALDVGWLSENQTGTNE